VIGFLQRRVDHQLGNRGILPLFSRLSMRCSTVSLRGRHGNRNLWLWCALALLGTLWLPTVLCYTSATKTSLSTNNPRQKVYQYFAFGSNVKVSTMTALRRIEPINATAAVLPNYDLYFDGPNNSAGSGSGGMKGWWQRPRPSFEIEPSAAFVTPSITSSKEGNTHPQSAVHGVLYTLSADDFARVGFTEGVPFGYRWQRCTVYPYVGDGESAGSNVLKQQQQQTLESSSSSFVSSALEAYTLVSATPPTRRIDRDTSYPLPNIPPSSSYLDIIQQGAQDWALDREYQEYLKRIPTAKNLLIPQGISGMLLQLAELAAGTRSKQSKRQ
jgi:hypothetical protein